MKNKVIYLNFFIVTIALLIGGMFFFSSSQVSYASIKDSNIIYNLVEKTIDIQENKVCNITEKITVTYKSPGINVGLSRNISKVNRITRIVDGKEYAETYINELELISVTMDGQKEYNFLEEDNDYYYINTGADGDFKVGQHVYEIQYSYDMGEDFISSFDDFTFDIMDYDFASPVEKFSATITLPKTFYSDENELENMLSFRTNDMEEIGGEALNLQVVDNAISVSYENLPSQVGFTIQLILPDGYFDTTYIPNALYFVVIAITILAVIGLIIILVLHKFHKKPIITPEFYPPKDCSTIDVANIYRGKIKSKDLSALIIEWVSKKLISMEVLDKNNIVLTKLKDFPNLPETKGQFLISKLEEKQLFNAMFVNGENFVMTKNNNSNNTDVNKAVGNLFKRPESVNKKITILRYVACALAVLPILMYLIWKTVLMIEYFYLFFVLLFPVIAMLVLTYVSMPIGFKTVWCAFFGGLPLIILVWAGYFLPYDICYLNIITAVVMIAGIYLSKYIKLFTKEELNLRGKVLGFKNFLKLVEVERLEMLIEEDHEYYYKVLPYCYVFNLTDKLEEKFKALNLEMPDYCQGYSATKLGGIVTSTVVHAYAVRSKAGSGRGFGGGGGRSGSSGGGGGGGGSHGR